MFFSICFNDFCFEAFQLTSAAFLNHAPNTMNLIPLFVALSALLYGVWVFLEARLESFYVFEPTQLHNFAKSAIAQHGNDTRAIVTDIVANLQTTSAKPYVNLDQEWIFNNAGGAMGAMYVIHASKLQKQSPQN